MRGSRVIKRPCYKCTERYEACWDTCPKWAAHLKEQAVINKRKQDDRLVSCNKDKSKAKVSWRNTGGQT